MTIDEMRKRIEEIDEDIVACDYALSRNISPVWYRITKQIIQCLWSEKENLEQEIENRIHENELSADEGFVAYDTAAWNPEGDDE